MTRVALSFLVLIAPAMAASAQVVSDHDRQDAIRHYKNGEQAMRREAFDEAEKEFQEASRLDPRLELAPYGLGRVYMSTKRYSAAVRAFLRSREVFEINAKEALNDRALGQQRLRDQITALEDEKHSYEMGVAQSFSTAATIERLNSQISQLRFQARRQSDQPAEVPAWISIALGGAHFRNEAMADAEREYRAALKAEPKLGEGHNNLAVVLMLTKRYDEAEQEVKLAEGAGFRVNPQFKADLEKAAGAR